MSHAAMTTDQCPCKSLSMTKGLATAKAIAARVGTSSLLLNHHAPAAAPSAEKTMRALTTQVAGMIMPIMLKNPSCGALRAKRSPPPKFEAVIPGESRMSMSRQANCPPKRKGHTTAKTTAAVKAENISLFLTLPAKTPRAEDQKHSANNC